MAKGQLRSNREKKKPKAEKNKKKSAPVPLAFERVRMIGKEASGRKFSYAHAEKSRRAHKSLFAQSQQATRSAPRPTRERLRTALTSLFGPKTST